MQQTLKFARPLIELVCNESKSATWRIDNTRKFVVGEMIECCAADTNEVFAHVKVKSVRNTTFRGVTDAEFLAHESYDSEQQMLNTYEAYYNKPITMDTAVTIITFSLEAQVLEKKMTTKRKHESKNLGV